MKLVYPFLFVLFLFCGLQLKAQKFISIEKIGSANTEKIFLGTPLTFQTKDARELGWVTMPIRDLLVEQNVIVFPDRYISVDNIHAFQFGRSWPKATKISLLTFGLAWSGFAAIGTATDGNPDTSYRLSDAVVTGTSALLAFSIPLVFGNSRKVVFGKKRRLRLLDITPVVPSN
ncbi:MAG: hypothetical protein AAFO07_06130 [Bacteroidota bacterium]